MSPMDMHAGARAAGRWSWLVAALVAASGSAQAATISIGNGSGSPGGSVAVTVSLADSAGEAATAQLDVLFEEGVLTVDPATDCVKAARLTDHILSATLPGSPPPPEGQRRLRLAILDTLPPVASFPDGDLATCNFHIAAGAELRGTTLTADRLQVAAGNGSVICGAGSATECGKTDGQVSIVPADTPTETPTQTPTDTVVPTQTRTPVPPSSTPTRTLTVPPNTPTRTATDLPPTSTPTKLSGGGGDNDSCAVVPAGAGSSTGTWLLLVVPALLRWMRKRS